MSRYDHVVHSVVVVSKLLVNQQGIILLLMFLLSMTDLTGRWTIVASCESPTVYMCMSFVYADFCVAVEVCRSPKAILFF